MKQFRLVLLMILTAFLQDVSAQDSTCNNKNADLIQEEIKTLLARLDDLGELKVTIEGQYSILYKEVRISRQVLPDTGWTNSVCVQKYDVTELRNLQQIRQHIENAFNSTRQSTAYYGDYIKIYFNEWLINNPETVRKSYVFIYKKD